ncbi:Peptidase family M23 [Thermosyntropha lipolytica DSM 11003]|uniref:Peptidase family M23 n=1 Tax=Thermosyntropha lipolytica DSM 11003 TaxID=1123382 RepID=A0A1M5MPF1_9FIRM|nr:M23 family metallopeptidase [Thermosyntropha lipolytica]SHG78779.1 Peptidase family M23 [Thermosyntropha lipolytica DSM 11003]
MLGSFRWRMLLALLLAIFASLSLQSGHSSQKVVEPALRYILRDYGVEDKIISLLQGKEHEDEVLPASADTIKWQKPCDFLYVEKPYGWYWNEKSKRQEFSPGIKCKVKNNSPVKPVMKGIVEEIGENDKGRYLLLRHDDAFFSLYGGLKEILVQKGDKVDKDDILGKSTDFLYLEIRDEEGPINPESIIE